MTVCAEKISESPEKSLITEEDIRMKILKERISEALKAQRILAEIMSIKGVKL